MLIPANPPALVIQVDSPVFAIFERLDKLEADKQAEVARIAEEALRIAREAAERERMALVWAKHPAGNNYVPRQCTWGVANWVKVPVSLGNAKYWYSNAEAWGFNVGAEPRVGAVGVSTRGWAGHVILVTALNADGTITIKEQNYDYRGSVRTRLASASEFSYIYF